MLRLKQQFIEWPDVLRVQSALKKLGFSAEPNGIFDENTDNAIKQFQREKDLTVDGVVGPATWAKLFTTFV